MGRMTDDMARLSEEIVTGRAARLDFLAGVKDAVENLREATVAMRGDFRDSHETMAAGLKDSLTDAVDQVKERVAELSRQSAEMRRAMRQSYQEMASDQQAERDAFIADLAAAVGGMLDRFMDARTNMAMESKAELSAFCDRLGGDAATLREETGVLLAAIRNTQQNSARDSREQRLAFLANQVAYVNQFMDRVAGMMADVRRGQRQAAGQERDSRQTFVSELKAEVAGQQLRFSQESRRSAQEVTDQLKSFEENIKLHVKELKAAVGLMRSDFSEDLAGARAAWLGRGHMGPLVPPKALMPEEPSPPAPPEPEEETGPELAFAGEEQAPSPPAEAEEPTQGREPYLEQLTVIKGIGPQSQSKLYLGGINTLAKLAGSDPKTLRELLSKTAAKTANVEDWIEQARKLI